MVLPAPQAIATQAFSEYSGTTMFSRMADTNVQNSTTGNFFKTTQSEWHKPLIDAKFRKVFCQCNVRSLSLNSRHMVGFIFFDWEI